MGFNTLDEIVTYQFADRFKELVHEHVRRSAQAARDKEFREELEESACSVASNLAEGFGRNNPAEFANFIRYALGSLREAETRLQDGIQRKYFDEADCQMTFRWAQRCRAAGLGLFRSQVKLAEANRAAKAKKRRPARGR